LVTRGVDVQDRRSRLLVLTGKGRAVLAAAVPIWRATHAAVEAGLPALEAQQVRSALIALA
jgi:DNA-binding MarR family transcriptional regulator